MKSVIAAIGVFAALANATAYHPRHFHGKRNDTAAAAEGAFTTLTVLTTEIKTITSCAATITNCPAKTEAMATLPASALQTVLVTNTIVLTETVCPVTAAASISASVIKKAKTGGIKGKTLTHKKGDKGHKTTTTAANAAITAPPLGGNKGETDEEACEADEIVTYTSVTKVVKDQVLTITLGKGRNTKVVTTTVQSTDVSTMFVVSVHPVTLYATPTDRYCRP